MLQLLDCQINVLFKSFRTDLAFYYTYCSRIEYYYQETNT